MKNIVVTLFLTLISLAFAQSSLEACNLAGRWTLLTGLELWLQQTIDPEETLWFTGNWGELQLELTEQDRTDSSVSYAARYTATDDGYSYALISEEVLRRADEVVVTLNGTKAGYLYTFFEDGSLEVAYDPAMSADEEAASLNASSNVEEVDTERLLSELELFGESELSGQFFCPSEDGMNLSLELDRPTFAGRDVGALPFARAE